MIMKYIVRYVKYVQNFLCASLFENTLLVFYITFKFQAFSLIKLLLNFSILVIHVPEVFKTVCVCVCVYHNSLSIDDLCYLAKYRKRREVCCGSFV